MCLALLYARIFIFAKCVPTQLAIVLTLADRASSRSRLRRADIEANSGRYVFKDPRFVYVTVRYRERETQEGRLSPIRDLVGASAGPSWERRTSKRGDPMSYTPEIIPRKMLTVDA